MDIYVKDSTLKTIDIVDSYSSIIWTNRYNSTGDFEIYIRASDSILNSLVIDNYIYRTDDEMMGIIEKHELITDEENGNYFSVTGRDLKSILDRRIVWRQTTLSGTIENCIRKLITENCINPTIPARKINKLILGPVKGFIEMAEIQVTGNNLLEVITDLCKSYSLGFNIFYDGKNFVFDLYKGIDRSNNQFINPRITFSNAFENLMTSSYEFNKQPYKNTALVAGEGEGLLRKTIQVNTGIEQSDLSRREIYIDARDISSNNEEISQSEYDKLLEKRGSDSLNENMPTKKFEAVVDNVQMYVYKKDYFLGDVVNVINEYNISSTPRVSEIIENEDENGYNLIPTFSTMEV